MADRAGTNRGWPRRTAIVVLLAPFVVVGLSDARAVMLAVIASVVGGWVGWEWRRRHDRPAETAAQWLDDTSPSAGRSHGWSGAASGALRTAVAILALGGVFVLLGSAAWPLLGAAAVVAIAGALWRRPRRATAAGRFGAPVPPERLPDLNTAALCQEWQLSALTLASARDAESLAAAVELRSAYLDEMERRHPDGFRRWVDSGGQVGDPARYLVAD